MSIALKMAPPAASLAQLPGAGVALVFGLDSARKVISPGLLRVLMASGVLLYGGVGVVSLMLGGHFLDYNVLAADPVAGQHLGILLVELGVGITVTSTMLTLFYAFAGRGGAA